MALYVSLFSGTRLEVYLSEEWHGRVSGLCGNYDGSSKNDDIPSTGAHETLHGFINSWKKTDCPDIGFADVNVLPCQVCIPMASQ